MYSLSNKIINLNPNHHREIKLAPINMDYCLLQFDAFKFFLGAIYMGAGGLYLTLIFSM